MYFSTNVPCQRIAVFLGFYEDAYQKTAKKRLTFIQLKTKQNSITQFFQQVFFLKRIMCYLHISVSAPISHFAQFTKEKRPQLFFEQDSESFRPCSQEKDFYCILQGKHLVL